MPQAAPMMALSLMGVSMTRSQPNLSSRPSLVLNAPPYTPTSSPMSTTLGSAAISSNSACLIASRNVTRGMDYFRAFPRDTDLPAPDTAFFAADFAAGLPFGDGAAEATFSPAAAGVTSPK